MPLRLRGRPFAWAGIVAVPLAAMLVSAAGATADPLAAHLWKDRVLLVVASDAADPKLRQQRDIVRQMGEAARERDLALVEVVGDSPEAAAVRRKFGLGPGFHALLIGKDGGAKLGAETPLRRDTIVPLIDSMPMRQQEMRQRS